VNYETLKLLIDGMLVDVAGTLDVINPERLSERHLHRKRTVVGEPD